MPLTRRRLLHLGLGAAGATAGFAAPSEPALKPDRVHQELVDGNRRFLTGHARHPHSSLAWAKRTGRLGQHPHALVLCCSDSRVSPEILFDQGIGDLFVVRVAGNVVNEDEVGSIEYGVEHLGIPVVVVLGHTRCGAVTAVVEGEPMPAEIAHLVARIQASHNHAKTMRPELKGKELIQATVRLNVIESVAALSNGVFQERVRAGTLRVEGGVYDLDTGRVQWLRPDEKG
jgi:carbonic anhydrase